MSGWDGGLYYHGMLCWYVKYDKTAWENNKVNDTKDNLRYTIRTANGDEMVGFCYKIIDEEAGTYETLHKSKTDPYPGDAGITTWDKVTGFTITDIKEEGGKITFKLNGGDPSTGVEETRSETTNVVRSEKILLNGQMLIRRGESVYNLTGIRIQ